MKTLTMMGWGVAMALLTATPDAAGGRLMQADKGEDVYAAQKCSMCHSLDGKGQAKGPLDGIGTKLTAAEIREWIVNSTEMTKKHNATRKPVDARVSESPEGLISTRWWRFSPRRRRRRGRGWDTHRRRLRGAKSNQRDRRRGDNRDGRPRSGRMGRFACGVCEQDEADGKRSNQRGMRAEKNSIAFRCGASMVACPRSLASIKLVLQQLQVALVALYPRRIVALGNLYR